MTTTPRRKYRYRSRAEAEDRVGELDRTNGVLTRALNEVLAGKVHWLERHPYRLGIACPASPCGGILIVQYDAGGTTGAWAVSYHLEDWCWERKQEYLARPCDHAAQLARLAAEVLAERDRLAVPPAGEEPPHA